MGTERLRWRSERQQVRLLAALCRPLEQWHQEWSTRGQVLVLEPCTAEEIEAIHGEWLAAASAEGSAWLCSPLGAYECLGANLLGVTGPDSLGLASAIGLRASRSLVAACGGKPAGVVAGQAPSAHVRSTRFGGTCLRLHGEDLSMVLVLDGALVDRWLETTPGVGAALRSREDALASATVGVRVALSLGESRLDAARGLHVGDVLVSSTSLNTPFELLVGDSAALALGSLCQHQQHRALKLEGAPMKPSP